MRLMASPMISTFLSTTHLRIMSFSKTSYLFGKSTKQLCISLIASITSCKYVKTSILAIDQLFCAVDVSNEIFIAQPFFLYQINFSAKQEFKCITQSKIIAYIVKLVMVDLFKVNKQIHITFIIESISKDRSKHGESLDLVFATKIEDSLQI